MRLAGPVGRAMREAAELLESSGARELQNLGVAQRPVCCQESHWSPAHERHVLGRLESTPTHTLQCSGFQGLRLDAGTSLQASG